VITLDELLIILIVAILGMWQMSNFVLLRRFEEERSTWRDERQTLLDRIQAPSFAEYTNKVIREKKAEQPQEEVKPVEFIS
jgi:hypothetical protein